MLNFKTTLKRFRRQRRDDLEMITGLSSLRKRSISSDYSRAKRVRLEMEDDLKLRQQLLEARRLAYAQKKLISSASNSVNSNGQQNKNEENSHYFNNCETPMPNRKGSAFGPSGETTISCVPKLITAKDCRNARLAKGAFRGILKPSTVENGKSLALSPTHKTSEAEYWTSFQDRYFARKARSNGPIIYGSRGSRVPERQGWNAYSSGMVTKREATLVQEMASSMVGSRFSAASTRSNFISSIKAMSQRNLESKVLETPRNQTSMPPPMALLKSIKPPTPGSVTGTSGRGILMGNWMTRQNVVGSTQTRTRAITKNYSVQQLMDIICGESNPTESDLTGFMFDPQQPSSPVPLAASSPSATATAFDFSADNQYEHQNHLLLSNQSNQNVAVIPGLGDLRRQDQNIYSDSSFFSKTDENFAPTNDVFMGPEKDVLDNLGFCESATMKVADTSGSVSCSNVDFSFSNLFDIEGPQNVEAFDSSSSNSFFQIGQVNSVTPSTKKSVSFKTDNEDNILEDIFSFPSSMTNKARHEKSETATTTYELNTPVPPKLPQFFSDENEKKGWKWEGSSSSSTTDTQLKMNLFSTYDDWF